MKLVRFGKAGKERPGLIDGDGKIRDLTDIVPDISGETLGPKTLANLVSGDWLLVQARACKADLEAVTLPTLTAVRIVAHQAKA